jgi:hypothetical protein
MKLSSKNLLLMKIAPDVYVSLTLGCGHLVLMMVLLGYHRLGLAGLLAP